MKSATELQNELPFLPADGMKMKIMEERSRGGRFANERDDPAERKGMMEERDNEPAKFTDDRDDRHRLANLALKGFSSLASGEGGFAEERKHKN